MCEKSYTEKLSMAVTEYKFEKFPAEVIDMAKNSVIDLLGAGIGGSVRPEADIIHGFAEDMSGRRDATIWGTWKRCGHLEAAMANGYQSHILEMDDIHTLACLHPGITVIPAAIATAERCHLSGKRLIEAVVAGYEAVIRVGAALGHSHYYFWHTTSTAGPFGSAAATGKLIGLTYEEMADALGNAGSQSGGLWQFLEENAMTKYLHCAKANYNGMIAAELAKRGLTGARKILEGDKGLLKATSTAKNPGEFFETCAKEYEILTAGHKPWPTCRHTHAAIEACLNIKEKFGIRINDILHIQVDTYRTATQVAQNNISFDNVRAAKFSISYGAAIALAYGKVTVGLVNDLVFDPLIRSLVEKTTVSATEEMESYQPEKEPARVTVEMKDKSTYSETVLLAKGEPSDPLGNDEIDSKYMSLASPVMTERKAGLLLEKCRDLESVRDISGLFEGL